VSDGRVPINVINLSMLQSPADQAYAIAQVTSQIIEWMRRQPGAQRPRLAYYIDEIAQDGGKGAIFPPHPYNPITKPGLTILLKQGRAFGVSCLLATQNAKDIDYKGLGQCDTWIVGRLKTAADIERLKLGMEAAQVEATHAFSDHADDIVAQVSGLEPGQLVVKTRSAGVQTYRQRWIRSLHERMTPAMLENWLRAEEVGTERAITAAQEQWNRGEAEQAIAALEGIIAAEPYFSRLAPATLQLCEWLYRTKQWARLADCAAALRETVRSSSGFELVHYYEGMAHYETGHLGRAREALERFVSQAVGGSGELAERCREYLLRIFVAQDDYDRLEEAVEAGEVQGGRSRLLEFCGAMKTALTSWPSLRGDLDDATVITGEEAGEIRYARKGDRSVHVYVVEVRRRLDDLLVAGPEIPAFDTEAAEVRRSVAERIAADTETQRTQEAALGEALAAAEAEIDRCELAEASSHIDTARKLAVESGLASDGLERVISLYRGAFAAGRESFRGWLLGLDPIQFELETAALFRSLGYEAQATKASGDGGVDVMATYQNRHYVIQCKRYRHPIQPEQIRAFATAIRNFDADKGIFVATSTFSDGCCEEAERHGIRLIDLDGLVRLYGGETGRRKTDAPAKPRRAGGRKRRRAPQAGPLPVEGE